MDIIFHRNCLDGAYSAYLMYLFCKTLPRKSYQLFVQHLKLHPTNELKQLQSEMILVNQNHDINQQFFHTKAQIPFHFVSMYAGDLFPIFPSAPGNILFMVDITPQTKQLMVNMSQRFQYVVIIDHHTSFSKCLQFIQQQKLRNVLYFWRQQKCATQLVQEYLFKSFGFPKNLAKNFQSQLCKHIEYVSSNDLKRDQNSLSKQFVLGFYYFEIQLSHYNPLLFKRIWSLKLQTILSKGQNQYKLHFQCLVKAVQNCQIFEIVKSKFKGIRFLASQMSDKGIISDLGSVLAFLSTKYNFQNLGMIYNKGAPQCKLSLRSYQFSQKKPFALEICQFYGGGGHYCAAGCSIAKNTFKQHFKSQGKLGKDIKITLEQIQSILFKKKN